jgi:hypothetical protein
MELQDDEYAEDEEYEYEYDDDSDCGAGDCQDFPGPASFARDSGFVQCPDNSYASTSAIRSSSSSSSDQQSSQSWSDQKIKLSQQSGSAATGGRRRLATDLYKLMHKQVSC